MESDKRTDSSLPSHAVSIAGVCKTPFSEEGLVVNILGSAASVTSTQL